MDHDNFSYKNKYRVSNIRHMTSDFFATNDITTHNNDYTHYSKFDVKSCIDHIYSNSPSKITHVSTITNGQSDHAVLSFQYHIKSPLSPV